MRDPWHDKAVHVEWREGVYLLHIDGQPRHIVKVDQVPAAHLHAGHILLVPGGGLLYPSVVQREPAECLDGGYLRIVTDKATMIESRWSCVSVVTRVHPLSDEGRAAVAEMSAAQAADLLFAALYAAEV